MSAWERYESKSKPGMFYYFNENTGETRWNPPSEEAKGKGETKDSGPKGNKRGTITPAGAPLKGFGRDTEDDRFSFSKKKSRAKRPGSSSHVASRSSVKVPDAVELAPKNEAVVHKFTAKMVVRLISGKALSDSKATYTCELSLWQLRLGAEVKLPEEVVKTAVAEGLTPTWEQTFTFGNIVDLSTCDMLKIRVYKGKMFGKKDKGEVILPLAKYIKSESNQKGNFLLFTFLPPHYFLDTFF
jgi:hypothetical protein